MSKKLQPLILMIMQNPGGWGGGDIDWNNLLHHFYNYDDDWWLILINVMMVTRIETTVVCSIVPAASLLQVHLLLLLLISNLSFSCFSDFSFQDWIFFYHSQKCWPLIPVWIVLLCRINQRVSEHKKWHILFSFWKPSLILFFSLKNIWGRATYN